MNALKSTLVAATAIAALGGLAACGTDNATEANSATDATSQTTTVRTPSDVLASTAWETTGATDQDGKDVALTDENVANFVGWAYFKAGGTFTMYTLDDEPKMQGDWTVNADGTNRHIIAKDETGKVMFERDSDIVTLTGDEFTYRVFPDEKDTSVYYDIVHTPTDHAEPTA